MWDTALPSFLIGLREGLEAGLIVSILVATLVRADQKGRLPQVWTGVLAAVALALSFGAVLTFTAANLSTNAQEAFGGALSVIAVGFVTAMVFWMRRSARNLSGEIREKVTAALTMGSGVLITTSFLAVGREGLETALFLWTNAKAAGQAAGPLAGAAIGLVVAAGLCWGLYRRVLKINLARFFTCTGIVLIVIAAGVLAYGLRDLQEGGVLPGNGVLAVHLGDSRDASSWYGTLLQGVFNLSPQMTWLQAVAYAVYLAVVLTLFVRGLRGAAAGATKPAAATKVAAAPTARGEATAETKTSVAGAGSPPAARDAAEADTAAGAAGTPPAVSKSMAAPATDAASAADAVGDPREPAANGSGASADPRDPAVDGAPVEPQQDSGADPRGRRRPRRWLVPVAVVAVPAVVAGTVIAVTGGRAGAGQTVAVSPTECGKGFTAPQPGHQTFQLRNTGSQTSEVYLIDPTTSAVYGEIEGLAPGTTRALVATIGSGSFAWRCVPTSGKAVTSAAVRVSGGRSVAAVLPVSEQDLDGPLAAYKAYVNQGLATLVGQVTTLQQDIAAGNLTAAKADWLTAHLGYASLGAAYGTFADFDGKINGRADGLPGGVDDPGFTGFHRLEYGLWHGQSASSLSTVATQLVSDVTGLRKAFPAQDFDAGDLPLRTHEILENTLQFELTADTDEGSGTNLATAQANLQGTQELLTVLHDLIAKRSPHLLGTVDADIQRLSALLAAQHTSSGWTPVQQLPTTARERINGATGQLLEDLSPIPDLLEIRKSA